MARPSHVKTDNVQKIIDSMFELARLKVMVGVPAKKTDRREGDDDQQPITNAALSYIHNFGAPEVGIPPRPFLVPGVKSVQSSIVKEFAAAGIYALSGNKPGIMKSYNRAGIIAQNAVRKKITDGPFVPLKPATIAARKRKRKSRKNTENFTTQEMLRSPHFYILYVMFVGMATGGLFVTANSGALVKSWGLTVAVLTTATALGPLANGGSRIFWGWLSDRTGRENTMAAAFFLQALALISVVTIGRTSGLMFTVTLILTFFTWGEIYSLFPSTLGDYFGSKHATSNYAFLYTAKGVAAIIGGYLAAILFEQFGSWTAVFYGSAVLAFLSSVTALALRTAPLPAKRVVNPALVSAER